MLNLNRAMVLGNATRNAELRTTPNGRSVASFAVATNRRWTNRETGESQEEVQFHEIVAWGKLSEIAAQIVKKGSKVYVEGRLRTRTWEGQDGARRERTEIIADNIIGLSPRAAAPEFEEAPADEPPADSKSKKEDKPGSTPTSEKPAKDTSEDEINLDEIPF
jgi:single-strand DNA-binding protein